MNKLAELQQRKAALVNDQQTMIDERDKTNERSFTEEQTTQFRSLTTQIEAVQSDIDLEEEVIEAQKRSAIMNGAHVGGGASKSEEKEKRELMKRFSMKDALNAEMQLRGQTGVEHEINEIAKAELRTSGITTPDTGFNIPSEMMFRADSQTVTQDGGEYGGSLVIQGAGEILPTFINRLGIQDLGVQIKTGLVGKYPLHSGEEYAFQNLGEVETIVRQKAKYGARVLDAKRTGMAVGISNQLLMQSPHNVDLDVRTRISDALNNRLLLDMINGDANGPNTLGILNDDVYEYAGAEGVADLVKILELEGAVDVANSIYGPNKYFMHNKLASILKGTSIKPDSDIMLMDSNNKLYGEDTFKSTLVPVLNGTDDNYPLIYGAFGSVVFGFWGGMNIAVDPYSALKSGEKELVVNVYRDGMASNPKAFAVNKKITLK